ncbi:TLC ATP/ADP transporter [Arabidopsis thaliana]|uniref:ADP,ATP carrier protein n=2 Tax=Arabidopsis thaliana TaxID=3702 RepID=F4JZA1_ARATH|nr:TLC ATP/ADP transporter [Arabidopsis thaliana]AED90855.1 TLC ATP/ADP transporter [Arabidopsis thaliana]|eukprot:NP_196150.2 TLC ATP/ADP transporter [Arabidopsis thaliana]
MAARIRLDAVISTIVTVHPHELPALLHSSSCFFFILSAYFVVLPLRDEGAISLGLSKLPGLFVGSLFLTLIAAPLSTFIFSLPNLSKSKALVIIHRFFSLSLVLCFLLWMASPTESNSKDAVEAASGLTNDGANAATGWDNHGWFYISVRVGFFLWVALLNLVAISSTWARIIDVMDSESGARLFGFVGAGATLGQLFGSVFAAATAWMGPYLLLFAALLMEFAAQSSKGITNDISQSSEELSPLRGTDNDHQRERKQEATSPKVGSPKVASPKSPISTTRPQFWAILDGMRLILASPYLLLVSLFLWLGAVISSFFYFQKVNIIATTIKSSIGRRRLFAQINSFVAVFILIGQLTLTGRILTVAGVTVAISASPFVALGNLVAIAIWPTWVTVAVSETLRKVTTYVVTRPGRELLFTVVSQDEKYKAKVCIDVIVQRLGDAAAAGLFEVLTIALGGQTSTASLYALPVCLIWIVTAFFLGRRQEQLAKLQVGSSS